VLNTPVSTPFSLAGNIRRRDRDEQDRQDDLRPRQDEEHHLRRWTG